MKSCKGGIIAFSPALIAPLIGIDKLQGNPGLFNLHMQELVQVESLAQMGVQLLLFALGLEFSLSKLRAVRAVALLGEACLKVADLLS